MVAVATPSLYEQLGGMEVVATVVEDFYGRILADHTLSPLFADKDIAALRRHQTRFISYVLGGPNQYAGRTIRQTHSGLAITSTQFAAVAGHLGASLAASGVPEGVIDQIIAHVAQLQDDVVCQ
jgi:hemoglobin